MQAILPDEFCILQALGRSQSEKYCAPQASQMRSDFTKASLSLKDKEHSNFAQPIAHKAIRQWLGRLR